MSIRLVKKVVGFVATVSLIACPLLVSAASTAPAQSIHKTVLSAETYKRGESPVLARNTARKPDVTAVESPAKVQRVHDKKAISRCWQRLMDMAREVRHAHHNKK